MAKGVRLGDRPEDFYNLDNIKICDTSEGHIVIKPFHQGISEMVNGSGAFPPSLASVV